MRCTNTDVLDLRPRAARQRSLWFAGVIGTCLTISAVAAAAQTVKDTVPAARDSLPIDPKAMAALKNMGGYLRTLQDFTIKGEGTREEVLSNGEKIQFGGTIDYAVKRPDRMKVVMNTDRKERTIYYDGKTMTIYAPRMKYYATVPAPPTIGAMLDSARYRYSLDMPVVDLFLWGTPRDGTKDITAAKYIGPAKINGVVTDQYAFRQKDVDWQLWVEPGDKPLPRKLVITTKTEPERPEYAITLDWNLSPNLDDKMFTFEPPKDAKKIDMLAALPPGERRPARKP